MKIEKLKDIFSICQVENYKEVQITDFCFIAKTDEENSLVCKSQFVPLNTLNRDDGWKGFRIKGVLDFSLIGILSKISSILASHSIGIFVVSTYNTDYVFVKEENFNQAIQYLKESGYEIGEKDV